MKKAIGGAYIINTIIVFIVIIFAFLTATLIYYKAYKVNNRIASAIEKYEGYNVLSYNEINYVLDTLRYSQAKPNGFTNNNCDTRHGVEAIQVYTPKYMYCIYELRVDDNYDKYGILTYIKFDVPATGWDFEFPIYSETERIYHFSEE